MNPTGAVWSRPRRKERRGEGRRGEEERRGPPPASTPPSKPARAPPPPPTPRKSCVLLTRTHTHHARAHTHAQRHRQQETRTHTNKSQKAKPPFLFCSNGQARAALSPLSRPRTPLGAPSSDPWAPPPIVSIDRRARTHAHALLCKEKRQETRESSRGFQRQENNPLPLPLKHSTRRAPRAPLPTRPT